MEWSKQFQEPNPKEMALYDKAIFDPASDSDRFTAKDSHGKLSLPGVPGGL
jgi:hypothetical protein